jgi:hypothetical protein
MLGVLMCCGVDSTYGKILTDVTYARRIAQTPAFEIGSLVRSPRTLKIDDLGTLFRETTGGVSERAILTYKGYFDEYWKASYSGRSGKAFEAFEVYRANRRLLRSGKSERLLITAMEGAPHHAADIVLIDEAGRVTKQFQLKAGATAAMEAIDYPKYTRMTIVTHRDSLERIRGDLRKAKLKAASRGKALSPKWRKIEDALSNGRLTDELISGLKTRTRAQIERITKDVHWPIIRKGRKNHPKTLSSVGNKGNFSGWHSRRYGNNENGWQGLRRRRSWVHCLSNL